MPNIVSAPPVTNARIRENLNLTIHGETPAKSSAKDALNTHVIERWRPSLGYVWANLHLDQKSEDFARLLRHQGILRDLTVD
jgi:hypothetical protein